MRKRYLILAILCFLAALLLATEVFGEAIGEAIGEEPKPLKLSLQVSFSVMDWTDLSMSYLAVREGWATEGNLIGGALLRRPALAVTVSIVKQAAFWMLTDAVYKQNKTLAWILIGTMVVFKGYILVHNFGVLR